ncbi:MAG: threonine/serine dehydratase [Rhizobiaceae bacterium]|nr:threonine/serine dehydratase [Rhizobiaceae bacterium]
MKPKIPNIENVKDASSTLADIAVRTPLLKNKVLDDQTGANVFIKPESLQRTGSFKFRGAFNAISNLSKGARSKGIVASSSGNHAQGIAAAAKLFDVPATIVMPSDAPALKVDRTRAHGATVIFYDRENQDRDEKAQQVLEETGGTYIHPFNNQDVIAGQGTVGLEMAEDLAALNMTPDRLLVCTGGGGLTAGVGLAINHAFGKCKIHPVEPEDFDDYRRSLISGTLERNVKTAGSVCDAIITPEPGEIGFEINRHLLSDGIVISDQEALDAVKFAYHELKLVVEPGGAAALAGLLQAGKQWQGETIGIVISGGNIDPELFARVIC